MIPTLARPPEAVARIDAPTTLADQSEDGRLLAVADTLSRVHLFWDGRPAGVIDLRNVDGEFRLVRRIRSVHLLPETDEILIAAGEFVAAYRISTASLVWYFRPPNMYWFLATAVNCVQPMREGGCLATFANGMLARFSSDGVVQARVTFNDCPAKFDICDHGRIACGTDAFSVSLFDPLTFLGAPAVKSRSRIYAIAGAKNAPRFVTWALDRLTLWSPDLEHVASVPNLPGMPSVAIDEQGRRIAATEEAAVVVYDDQFRSLGRFELESKPLSVRLKAGWLLVTTQAGMVLRVEVP